MSNASEYGPRLYAYLAEHWRAAGTNQNAWCVAHGLQGPTVSRWQDGTEPKLPAFRQVAEALGVPILDVLVAAGVLSKREAGGRDVAAPVAPSLDVALKSDTTVSPFIREQLADMLDAFRKVEAGSTEAVTTRGKRGKRTGRG